MKNTSRMLVTAIMFLGCTLSSARLARMPWELAPLWATLVAGGGILLTAALLPATTFSRRVLLGTGAILAACTVLPVAFVADPAAWARQNPALLGNYWLWLMLLALPAPRAKKWCLSPVALLLTAVVLGGGLVAATLWSIG